MQIAENCILIRFEDLIKDPKDIFLELEKVIASPTANWNKSACIMQALDYAEDGSINQVDLKKVA